MKPDDPVQLQLEGVRLKTGLKLLLDQVGLTYQVVPEDNLLILTDTQGSADPIDRVLSEIKALHRDLHDVQDAIDEIRGALGPRRRRGRADAQADDHRGDAPRRRAKDREGEAPKETPAPAAAHRSRPGSLKRMTGLIDSPPTRSRKGDRRIMGRGAIAQWLLAGSADRAAAGRCRNLGAAGSRAAGGDGWASRGRRS